MKKPVALIGSTAFFFLAPGIIAGYVPWRISAWRIEAQPWNPWPVRWLGGLVIAAGIAALVECFARFALHGRGTPAPPMPTETMVVSGLYRYVRNPMYVAVFAIVAGQGLLFGDRRVLLYAACVWLGFTVFVLLYEEPTLRRRYGSQFDTYCAHVRRWLPRLHPWTDSANPR